MRYFNLIVFLFISALANAQINFPLETLVNKDTATAEFRTFMQVTKM